MKRFTDFLIFISVFISSITFFTSPFEGYLHYLIFLVLFPFFISRYGFPALPFKLLFLPLLVGLIQVFMGNDTAALFSKIFVGLLLSTLFYYYVIQYYEEDMEKIFELYLRGAVIVSYIGLVQFISYRLHFSPGYNYRWLFNKWGVVPGGFGIRINSVFSEASQMAIVISPACFVAVYNIFLRKDYVLKRHENYLLLLALILTTSSTGFFGLFVIGTLLTLNYGRITNLIVAVIAILVTANLLYSYVPDFRSRVDTSLSLWQTEEFSLENVNSSSFVLYNNYHIAYENLKNTYLLGSGLGSHPVAFDKYSLTRNADILDITFNKADANSLFLRLMSETGLLGMVFVLVFISRNFVRRNLYFPDNNQWIISNALLVIIVLYLLRQGNYFLNGFPLFMWMYYYNRLTYTNWLEQKNS